MLFSFQPKDGDLDNYKEKGENLRVYSYTPRTLLACCSQFEFKILKYARVSVAYTARIDSFAFWIIEFVGYIFFKC